MVDRWSVMVGGKKDSPPLLLSLLRSARNSDRWFPPWGGERNREEMVSTTD